MREKLSRFRALASYGYPAYVCHGQLMGLLAAQGLAHLQSYFAKPDLEPDKKVLRYTTDLDGTVQRRADLSAEEFAQAQHALAELRDALDDCIAAMREQLGPADGGVRLLEQARRVPAVPDAAGEFLRFVDGQPVVCFWGFDDPFRGGVDPAASEWWGDDSAPGDLPLDDVVDEAAAAASMATPDAALEPEPPAPPAPRPTRRPPAPQPPPPPPPPPKPPPPKPRPPAPKPAPKPAPTPPPKPAPPPPKPAPAPRRAAKPAGAPPTADAAPRRRWRFRLRLPQGRGFWLWSAAGLIVLLLPTWWLLKTFTTVFPLGFDAEGVPIVKGRKVGPPMVIPAGALERSDLSFLDGVWQVGDERQPVYRGSRDNVIGSFRLVVHFNAKGESRVFGLEREYAGKPAADCNGTATARAVGPKLYFETQVCVEKGGGGRNLIGSRHECQISSDGRTQCRSFFTDGIAWDGTLRRLR